jgi:hypothetical protein
MAAPALAQDDLPLEAAQLAAAMLRFQEPLAHVMSAHTPEGMPVVGVDAYAFLPSSRRVPRDQVAQYLAALPDPAMLAPTTIRGIVGLILLQELTGERRTAMQHALDNQAAALTEYASAADTERVLLEFDEESHLFSLGAVRLWAQRFGVLVGWNMGRCDEPTRAEWRFKLFGGDGHRYSQPFGR